MNNFNLIQKTNIIFGAKEENNVGSLIARYTSRSVLIVHDGGSYLKDLLYRVKESITKEGITIYELPSVKANPIVSTANEGIRMVRENNIEFVLTIGGGSVMDTAKYIAFATYSDMENPLLLSFEDNITTKIIPHGTIVTLSGTSSECSNCAMMMDDLHEPLIKYALSNSCLYFDFAIIDPEIGYTLPMKQMAAGIMDTISHALEVYLAQEEEEVIVEGEMEHVIRTTIEYGKMAMKDPKNYKVRSTLSILTMMAYRDDISNGGVPQDWGIHGVENPVTATYNGIHGQTLGILTPAFMKVASRHNPRPFVNLSVRVWGVDPNGKTEEEIIAEGAERQKEWLREMKLPTTFSEIGITMEMLEPLIPQAVPCGAVYQLNEEEVREIYTLSL